MQAEQLEARYLLSADLVISEFMASNDTTINDGFGEDSDWIEIHNRGEQAQDLEGYHLTDDQADLGKWTFPGVVILPDEYLLVFASGLNTTDPLGYQHTNFKLSADGEYVALTSPDQSVISEYGTNGTEYPPQVTDVSYGLGLGTLLDATTQIEWLLPTDGSLGLNWTAPGFAGSTNGFQTGLAAIGYENSASSITSYEPYISTEVPSGTTSVYIRHEFGVEDASQLGTLNLHVQFDDGFIAYLNGQPVIRQNAPSNPVWNSIATSSHNDGSAIEGVTFSLASHLDLIQSGTNTLAFHALNRPFSSDYLFVPRLVGDESTMEPAFLARPTPGQSNSETIRSGPVIADVTATPNSPMAGQPVLVTAEVQAVAQSVNRASVELVYRRMFEQEVTLRMFDDGTGPDSIANDGIYSIVIPGSTMNVGEMVRWYVTAADVEGTASRSPRFADPTNSAQYFGLVVEDPNTSPDLPTLFWFVEDTDAAQTRSGTRASIFLNGQFYDNVAVDLHGQSTAGPEFLKKSFDFDANSGEKFQYRDDTVRVSDFNLLTNYADQTKLRQPLAYEMNRQAGVPTLNAFPISVHRNGQFYGLFDFVEEGDEEFLERLGLNTGHSLYKVNNPLTSAFNEVTQLAGTDTTRSDLQEVVSSRSLSQTQGRVFDFDHLDIADLANYLAVNALILNNDLGHKNMYWYRDSTGTGLWSVWAWDVDLSFGHNWGGADPPYFDDRLYTNNGVGQALNNIFSRLLTDPRFSKMYQRRIRTLMDEFMGGPGTAIPDSYLWHEIDSRRTLVADEAVADMNLWGLGPNFTHTPEQAAQQLLDEFLPRRRAWLEGNDFLIPDPHSQSLDVRFGSFEYAPQSGNINEQYIVISNNENFAVDLSGWSLSGSTEHTLKPGTVIPANDQLFIVSDVQSFLSRSSSPRGGEKRFIQINQSGPFNAVGGRLRLFNKDGDIVDQTTYGVIGDFNGDGDYSCSDINTLTGVIAAGVYSPVFDLTGDGALDLNDRDAWLAEAGNEELGPGLSYLVGDTNLDGASDISDFNIWNANKFQASSAWCNGDINADGVVDISDFNAWNTTKFTSAIPQNSPTDSSATRDRDASESTPVSNSHSTSQNVFTAGITRYQRGITRSTQSSFRSRSVRSQMIDMVLKDWDHGQDFLLLTE